MKFPLAFAGVKKLFASEILKVIATACTLIAAIAGVILVASIQNASGGGMLGSSFVTLLFSCGAAVLLIIAYIFKLIGLKKGGYDEPKFRQAFIISIFALVLSVTASILNAFNVGNGIVDNIVQVFATVADIVTTIYVIQGIQNMAFKQDKQSMVDMGSKLMILIVIFYVLALIATIVPIFFGSNETTATISGVIAIVGLVLELIAYIIFIIYLGRAKNMLAED